MQISFGSAALAVNQDLMLSVIQSRKHHMAPMELDLCVADQKEHEGHEHMGANQITSWPTCILVEPRIT